MNRYALLIGINHYAENALGYDPLNGAVHDIERMEAYLKRNFQMSDAQITKLTATSAGVGVLEPTATQPTRANIVRAFRHLINIAQAGDFVYIHYSGHGGRATTCLPEFKGQNELDEGLVPMDIGDQESNYVRDVELTHYCRELVQKGTILTVVLDCCHSGGMDRGLGHAKRRTSRNSEPDRTPRPPSEFDVDRAVLAQYLHSSPNRARNSAFGKGWLPEPEGYTLLAACRSTESAWEGLYDDHTPGGMLTSAWLQALENFGLNQSYQTIYEQVRTEVWRNFPQQTPQLFGEAAREVFSASERKPIFAVSVLKVAPQRLLLDAGQAQGVQNMTQFAIYPSMTEDFTQVATRKAIVTVEQAMATQSWATISEELASDGTSVAVHDRAVMISAPAFSWMQDVAFILRKDLPAHIDQSTPLKAVEDAIQESQWLKVKNEKASLQVAINGEGAYEIWDAAGNPLPNILPHIQSDEANAAARVSARLEHIARYRAVSRLRNYHAESELADALEITVLGKERNYDPALPRNPVQVAPVDGKFPVVVGDTIHFRVTNRAAMPICFTVIALQPDWSIVQTHPARTDSITLDPGVDRELSLGFSLPEGMKSGTDLIKFMIALAPTNFRWLLLPSLNQPRSKGAGMRSPSNSLERLMKAMAEDSLTRNVVSVASPSNEWFCKEFVVEVSRESSNEPEERNTGQSVGMQSESVTETGTEGSNTPGADMGIVADAMMTMGETVGEVVETVVVPSRDTMPDTSGAELHGIETVLANTVDTHGGSHNGKHGQHHEDRHRENDIGLLQESQSEGFQARSPAIAVPVITKQRASVRHKLGLDGNAPIDTTSGQIAGRFQDLDVFTRTGVGWVRVNFIRGPWQGPHDTTLHSGHTWIEAYRTLIRNLRHHNLRIYGLIGHELMADYPGNQFRQAPVSGTANEWIRHYAETFVTVAREFGRDVEVFESFNEPDDWHGQQSNWLHPGWFAILLQEVYSRVRAEPGLAHIKLVSGPLQGLEHNNNAGTRYLASTYDYGKQFFGWGTHTPFPFDGIGYHLYIAQNPTDPAAEISHQYQMYMTELRQTIQQQEGQVKPIYLSEYGWQSTIGHDRQAECLTIGLQQMLDDPSVALGIWFCAQDFAEKFGVLDEQGRPKPGLDKLAAVASLRHEVELADVRPAQAVLAYDDAAYVPESDWVKDDTAVGPGTIFAQRWQFKNRGTTTWGPGYALMAVEGTNLGMVDSVQVPACRPGETVEVIVPQTAPLTAGVYRSVWRLANDAQIPFGDRVWTQIKVVGTARGRQESKARSPMVIASTGGSTTNANSNTANQTVAEPPASSRPNEWNQEIYNEWREHVRQGYKNNRVMFEQILQGIMNPYYSTIWMYRILFGVGVLAFVGAVILGVRANLQSDTAAENALWGTLALGGLGVTAFLTYFISRPLQALEENLFFITWLGIVYNTYWNRVIFAQDPATFQQESQTATADAVREIREILAAHGQSSRARPNLSPTGISGVTNISAITGTTGSAAEQQSNLTSQG